MTWFLNSPKSFLFTPFLAVSPYKQRSTYSRDLLRVTLRVLKVRGCPAPLPTPLPSRWTLQEPPCQRLIQLQHGLPLRHCTVLIQFHISLCQMGFGARMGVSFPIKPRPQCALLPLEESQSVWRMRVEGAASPVVWKLQYPPPVLGAAPCSVLSGGNGILQPHDPCLAVSFSGSLSFFHTHIYTQGEELWPLPSSNP